MILASYFGAISWQANKTAPKKDDIFICKQGAYFQKRYAFFQLHFVSNMSGPFGAHTSSEARQASWNPSLFQLSKERRRFRLFPASQPAAGWLVGWLGDELLIMQITKLENQLFRGYLGANLYLPHTNTWLAGSYLHNWTCRKSLSTADLHILSGIPSKCTTRTCTSTYTIYGVGQSFLASCINAIGVQFNCMHCSYLCTR